MRTPTGRWDWGHDDTDTGEGEVARLTQRLIGTLEPVVGANAIRASVNIDYDQNSTEESDEKYDPSVSALLSVQRSEDDSGGGARSVWRSRHCKQHTHR